MGMRLKLREAKLGEKSGNMRVFFFSLSRACVKYLCSKIERGRGEIVLCSSLCSVLRILYIAVL